MVIRQFLSLKWSNWCPNPFDWFPFPCWFSLIGQVPVRMELMPTLCQSFHTIDSLDLFHKGFMSSWLKSCENSLFNCDSNDLIRSEICTYHDSLAVVTCAKLWSDLISIFEVRVTWNATSLDYELTNPLWNGSQDQYISLCMLPSSVMQSLLPSNCMHWC